MFTWTHRLLVAVLLVLAPATTATLSANSRLGENILDACIQQVEHVATATPHRDCGECWPRSAAECSVAPSSAPRFGTWNQFQAGTRGQFASRAEAANAWGAYKQANGIVTGTVRGSQSVRSQFLRSLVDDYRTPSSMKQWLEQGRVPPGYEVDHIKPLSVGGPDTPANMRLQGTDLHRLHHQFYRPWEW